MSILFVVLSCCFSKRSRNQVLRCVMIVQLWWLDQKYNSRLRWRCCGPIKLEVRTSGAFNFHSIIVWCLITKHMFQVCYLQKWFRTVFKIKNLFLAEFLTSWKLKLIKNRRIEHKFDWYEYKTTIWDIYNTEKFYLQNHPTKLNKVYKFIQVLLRKYRSNKIMMSPERWWKIYLITVLLCSTRWRQCTRHTCALRSSPQTWRRTGQTLS